MENEIKRVEDAILHYKALLESMEALAEAKAIEQKVFDECKKFLNENPELGNRQAILQSLLVRIGISVLKTYDPNTGFWGPLR